LFFFAACHFPRQPIEPVVGKLLRDGIAGGLLALYLFDILVQVVAVLLLPQRGAAVEPGFL